MKLDAANAKEYLRAKGRVAPSERIDVRKLSGGVSNVVLYVSCANGNDFVLKQVREQLDVAEPWFCSIDRIWRETEVLQLCHNLTTTSNVPSPLCISTPQLIFEDRENHLYAMTAAPRNHVVWKSDLLNGRTRMDVAASCGILLGRIHAGTWHDADVCRSLEDRRFFDDLRLDPYYRQIARVHADMRPAIEGLIKSVWDERHCLVHGDFSPKNLLVSDGRLMLIDFEVGHFGDPAFDLGFFLSPLLLKAFHRAPQEASYFQLMDVFWHNYQAEIRRFVRHMNSIV